MNGKLKKYSSIIVLALIILASSWALFSKDFFRFHDFTQGARIVEMTHAIKDGHFPPIWSSNLGYGYGMPLFEFYAPLPYYVGSLIYMSGVSLIGSIKALILISSIITAIGAYFLGKKLFGITGGLLVSAALTMAPYRAVNLFVRGAISEAWGIMVLPFILLGIIKTIKNEKHGWLLLTISIAVLLLSHNLTALVFLPLSVVFGAGFILLESSVNKDVKKEFWLIVLKLAGLYALAVIISSYYIIPAFFEKGFTRLESTILAEYFNYKLHFVGIKQFVQQNWGYGGSTYGPMDGISFYLGLGQIIGLFLSVYLLFKSTVVSVLSSVKTSFNKNTVFYLLLVLLFGISLLMTTNKTMIIWDSIPLLSFLQFPWRYLSAATVFLSLIVGSLTLLFPTKPFKYGYSAILLILMLSLNAYYFQPEKFSSDLSEYYYSDSNKLRTEMSTTLPDYIPSDITQKEISPVALEGQVLQCEVLGNCDEEIEVLENKVHSKVIRTNFEEEKEVVFAIANYPGWVVIDDEYYIPTQTTAEGFIKAPISAGEHQISIILENTPIRRRSNYISIFGLVIFLATSIWYHKRNDR